MSEQVRPLLVPLDDACAMLGLCRQTLYRMEKDKEIRFTRIRGRTLVPMSELERIAEPVAMVQPVGDLVEGLKKRRPKKLKLFPALKQ